MISIKSTIIRVLVHLCAQEESGNINLCGPAANRTRILSSGDSRSIHSTTGPKHKGLQRYRLNPLLSGLNGYFDNYLCESISTKPSVLESLILNKTTSMSRNIGFRFINSHFIDARFESGYIYMVCT